MINEKIAEKVKSLRKELGDAYTSNSGNDVVNVKEAKYNYYLKGIEDSVGFVRTCRIVKMSKEL